MIKVEQECDHCTGSEGGIGNVKQITAKNFLLRRGFAFDHRFIVRAKSLGQQVHAQLGKEDVTQPK